MAASRATPKGATGRCQRSVRPTGLPSAPGWPSPLLLVSRARPAQDPGGGGADLTRDDSSGRVLLQSERRTAVPRLSAVARVPVPLTPVCSEPSGAEASGPAPAPRGPGSGPGPWGEAGTRTRFSVSPAAREGEIRSVFRSPASPPNVTASCFVWGAGIEGEAEVGWHIPSQPCRRVPGLIRLAVWR